MPDVGVLNLQIHDDSAKAAEGLGRLATALGRVKAAVGSGLKLGGIASQIRKINDALAKAIPEQSLSSLERFASAIEKLNATGGVKLSGAKEMAESFNVEGTAGKIRDQIESGVGEGFRKAQSGIEETTEQIDGMNSRMENFNQTESEVGERFGKIQSQVEETTEQIDGMNSRMESFNKIESGVGEGFRKAQSGIEETTEQIDGMNSRMEGFSQTVQQTAEKTREAMQSSLGGGENQGSGLFNTQWYENKIAELTAKMASAQERFNSLAGKSGTKQFKEAQATVSAYADEIKRLENNLRDMLKYQGKTSEQLEEMRKAEARASFNDMQERIKNFRAKQESTTASYTQEEIGKARELYQNESDFMKESIANKYGMSVSEMFPTGEAEQATSAMMEAGNAVKTFQDRLQEAAGAARQLASRDLTNMKESIMSLVSPLTSLASQFARVAKYRILRAILKQISEGFKEGTENYYRYSQAIGSSFAPAMDSAAASLLQMKNSLGAAIAPLIQSLIPYLQMAVSWFVSLVNYANQFMALLRGQATWSRATQKSTKAFDDVKKSAGKAAASIKELLADWDELNIIQSESGGGGGGSGGTKAMKDYLGMFEEVSKFDKEIKSLVDNIEKRFGSVANLVKEIGLALLAWRVSTAFSGLLGSLASLVAAGAIIDLTFKISQVLTDSYLDTGNVGFLVADVLGTLLGGVLAKKVLSKVLGGSLARVAIPLTFAISALATIKSMIGATDVSALDQRSIGAAITAGLEGGTAAGYLFHLAGYGLGSSIGGGVGLAVVTFGVAIGLKAIAQVAEDGKLTSETLGADFLSAGAIGAGLALTEVALGGSTITALTLGGGAALLTLGALVAIQAVVAEVNRSTVKWGNYQATQEEIQAFVEQEIFEGAAPTVKLSLANAKIEELGQSKTELESQMSEVLGELEVVSIGLKSSAESDLKEKVKTLVDTYNKTGKQYQEALELSVSLVPVKNAEGQDESKEIVKNSKERWTDLNGIMQGLAHDLTKAFDIAYNKDLDEATRSTAKASIEKISNMMTQVADAIASGQAKAKVAMELNKNLANLSKDSMGELIKEYDKQREQLIQELTKTSTDAAEGILAQQYAYEKLAEYALREAGGNTEDTTYQEYKRKAEEAAADYAEITENVVKNATEEADKVLKDTKGVQDIRKALLEKSFADLDLSPNALLASAGFGGIPEEMGKAMSEMLLNDKSYATDTLTDAIYSLLWDAVGPGSYQTYKDAIESGIISMSDIFSKDLIDTMADAMGIPDDGEVRKVWDEIINEILGIGESEGTGTEGVQVDIPVNVNPVYSLKNEEAGFDVETEQPNVTGRRPWTLSQLGAYGTANAAARYANSQSPGMNGETQIAVTMDSAEQSNNIQNGVQRGTGQLLAALQGLTAVADAINKKSFTVNILPTSALGGLNARSSAMYGKITGETVLNK